MQVVVVAQLILELLELEVLVVVVQELDIVLLLLEYPELLIWVVVEVDQMYKVAVPVVPVSLSSVIRSVNSQSKQLVEQFPILAVRPFIPLLRRQTLLLLILL